MLGSDQWLNDMSDVITGLRQVIQDLVATDLKAQSAKLDMLQKLVEIQHDTMVKTLDAFRAEMRSEFVALRGNSQMEVIRQMMPIRERAATIEARAR